METKAQEFYLVILYSNKLSMYMYRSTSLLFYNSVAMQLICVTEKDFRFNSGLSMSTRSVHPVPMSAH